MSKVLFIGNFKDGTGWSHGCIDYALALDAVGVDVVVRSLKLNGAEPEVPPRILELAAKSADSCDVCIQMVLPHMMRYYGEFRKNIGIYFTETDNFKYTDWPAHINMMDEAWTPCEQGGQSSLDSGVTIPIHVVNYPCNISKFQKSHKPLPLKGQLGGRFLFYTIGEATKRKNLVSLLQAFHLEFHPNEPVELLIKARENDPVNEICNQIKGGLGLYPKLTDYKQELVLKDYLSEADMLRLHATGDCYVGPSHGEGWGIPAFEAMAMGKTPIVSKWGAFLDYVDPQCGHLVRGHMVPVFGMSDTCGVSGLYSSRERWFQVDIAELRSAMRLAYETRGDSQAGITQAMKFSYSVIGNHMKGLLNA